MITLKSLVHAQCFRKSYSRTFKGRKIRKKFNDFQGPERALDIGKISVKDKNSSKNLKTREKMGTKKFLHDFQCSPYVILRQLTQVGSADTN